MTRISKHAIDNYIERVLDSNPEDEDEDVRKQIEMRIIDIVYDPDQVYHGEKDKPQIHIKGDAAVVVGVEDPRKGVTRNGNAELGPYNTLIDKIVVPTVYHSDSFIGKNNEQDAKKPA